jgi:diguanylate cyclase (GGDEF)-like protein/PAS domain S-box-containing protein
MIFYLSLSIIITASFILLVSRRLLEEVQTEKEKYNTAFHSSPYAILLTKLSDGKIFEVNEGFVRISGYQPQEVIGKTTIEMGLWVQEKDRLAVANEISRGNEVREYEFLFRVKSGDTITGLLSSKRIMAYGETSILTSISDITAMNKMKEKLLDMAMHDTLTGLPNRKLFFDRAEIAIANAKRDSEKIAVVSLDVDLLKSINDHWGHGAGDKVLITLSNRLSNLLRKGDTIARFGGDEFLVLLTGMNNETSISIVAKKVLECLSMPIDIEEDIVNATASIGIALYPDDDNDINALIKKSDEAMYHVKEHGRNSFVCYSDLKGKLV